ncbi:MAG: hypothetical protein U9P49_11560 [Thermodesulfobacteriota bacterium]|nr:hypothetical protein [Thermodesulfobacteriota bacterium]
MKRHRDIILSAILLLAISSLLYLLHYLVFHDPHHIFIYMLGDLAFLPIEVFLVVVIIERLLESHEKNSMLQRLNMVIGTFFSELGTHLLGDITQWVENVDEVRDKLAITDDWSEQDYKNALSFIQTFDFRINQNKLNLSVLRDRLGANRDLLVMLLANPNLLEHISFTDLLWAIFHLMEELGAREKLDDIPQADLAHITGDIKRVYSRLIGEWIRYCKHLQDMYPYMFSFVVRTHPLQDNPCATVTCD